MKMLLRITPMVLVILGLFFIIGCEETEEDVNPLVGTWDFSNMEKTVLYTFVDSSLAPFYVPGDTVGDGPTTVTWTEFSDLGVNGTVAMLEDGTFTLSGTFPVPNDTLGFATGTTPLTDTGDWVEDKTAGTLAINGAFYQLGGLMTMNDAETEITLVYAASAVDTFVLPVSAGPMGTLYIPTALNEAATTTLGFTKQ